MDNGNLTALKLYASNGHAWATETKKIFVTGEYKHRGSGTFYGQVILLQVLDRGINTLFGGDPFMTVSGRVWRDRRDNLPIRVFNWLLTVTLHKNGPGDKSWPNHGEGSTNDRNLPNPQQGYAVFFGGAVLAGLVYVIKFYFMPGVTGVIKIIAAAF